jgi:hypothetical protein
MLNLFTPANSALDVRQVLFRLQRLQLSERKTETIFLALRRKECLLMRTTTPRTEKRGRAAPFIPALTSRALSHSLLRASIADMLQAGNVQVGVGFVAGFCLFALLHLRFLRLGHHLFVTHHRNRVVYVFGKLSTLSA